MASCFTHMPLQVFFSLCGTRKSLQVGNTFYSCDGLAKACGRNDNGQCNIPRSLSCHFVIHLVYHYIAVDRLVAFPHMRATNRGGMEARALVLLLNRPERWLCCRARATAPLLYKPELCLPVAPGQALCCRWGHFCPSGRPCWRQVSCTGWPAALYASRCKCFSMCTVL